MRSKTKMDTVAPVLPSDVAMGQAWQALVEHRFKEAEKLSASVIKMNPGHAQAWHLRALAALALSKPKLALQYLAHATQAPELLPGVAQARGRALLALGRVDEALASFQETLSYKADDASTYHLLALAQLAHGDHAAARKSFRNATLLDPELGAAHYELGVLALSAGDFQAAQAALEVAAVRLPAMPQVFNNLGLAQQGIGDLDAAELSLREAVGLNADYAEAWFNLALVLTARGEANGALLARETALRLNPALAQVPV